MSPQSKFFDELMQGEIFHHQVWRVLAMVHGGDCVRTSKVVEVPHYGTARRADTEVSCGRLVREARHILCMWVTSHKKIGQL